MERFSHNICQKNLRDHFLLDAMLLRMACTQPCPNTEALLVNLSALMECPVKELRVLSKLAAVLARQDGSAYLSMGLELGERDWLGLEYIQKNADILYTDQFSEARKHGFHSVILHDCIIMEDDVPDDCVELTECCLFQCRFTDSTKVAFTRSTVSRCKFEFSPRSLLGSIAAISIRLGESEYPDVLYRGRKMQLNDSAMQDCSVVCVEKGDATDFFEFNNTSYTRTEVYQGISVLEDIET